MWQLRQVSYFSILLVLFGINPAFAQETVNEGPSAMDLIILFVVAILFVVGIIIYMMREIIMRKKTNYDRGKFESQKDRDYEKYHSEWGDETLSEEKKRAKQYDDEFREQLEDEGLPDYYKILGVPRDATKDEIKKQYRKLAKEVHPDKAKTQSSEEEMAEINKAYEVLSDEEKKERYDKFLDVS